MPAHGWITLIASLGQLALVVLVLRARRGPLTASLALLCLDLAGFNLAALARDLSGLPGWGLVDLTIAPFGVPLTLDVVLVFTGRRRAHRWLRVATYLGAGLLGLDAAVALVHPPAARFVLSPTYVTLFLGLLLPVFAYALGLLALHARREPAPDERMRSALLLLAFVLGGGLATTDLVHGLGLPVPRLTALGTLIIAVTLAVVALRFRLLEGAIARRATFWSVAAAAALTLAYAATYSLLAERSAILLAATLTLALVATVAVRSVGIDLATRRRRLGELATLGRFSAQMAHDLKNPLAAAKGAAGFLREERAQGRSLDDQAHFLELLEGELDRIGGVLDTYERLGEVAADRRPLDLNALVGEVVALCAVPEAITVTRALDPALPRCAGDAELLRRALTNLVQNAVQALDGGGTLTVRTTADDPGRVRLEVADTGAGMDARTRERAFDEFWTTKATGSGLGLGIVRRVAEAHGGEVLLRSAAGRGTTVTLVLPAA